MAEFEDLVNKILDTFFHLPTLIVLATICIIVLWTVFDVSLDFGNDFIRLNSNRGNVNLYWGNGCCELDL